VAQLPARTQPVIRSLLPTPSLERAEMQVCHVSYSALLDGIAFSSRFASFLFAFHDKPLKNAGYYK